MKKHRVDAKVDANQPEIVETLRYLGYSVEVGHDDLLIGKFGITAWYEIKNPETALDKNGRIYADEIKKSQRELLRDFKGHYRIVSSVEEILNDFERLIK